MRDSIPIPPRWHTDRTQYQSTRFDGPRTMEVVVGAIVGGSVGANGIRMGVSLESPPTNRTAARTPPPTKRMQISDAISTNTIHRLSPQNAEAVFPFDLSPSVSCFSGSEKLTLRLDDAFGFFSPDSSCGDGLVCDVETSPTLSGS